MKRTISLWLGLLAFALMPVLAQAPAAPKGPTGKIHGHINGPEGAARTSGTVSLSNDGGKSNKFTFQVSSTGDYEGEATPGSYTVIFRAPETPADKMVDSFNNIKIVVGQDVLQDFDMSRKEFIEKNLTVEQRKELEEIKKHNTETVKANEVIKHLNDDLKVCTQDFKEADAARATATQALGAGASRPDIDAKEIEIRTAKYNDVETLMLRDTAAKPDASVLWAQLGQAQLGLAQLGPIDDRPAKFAQAETTYKKVLELEAASKKPSLPAQGAANAGLGEIYARTGKIAEATAAYDSAAKVNPTQGGFYYKNEAVIFYQLGQPDAQVAAADAAIKANEANKVDPSTQAILYYLKGQGLVQKATVDTKTGMYILPAGCADAYQMYLQLAPTGQFANDAKGILTQAGQKINTNYKAPKK
jgi:tetratricopeptide (TPR) repeat protein